MTAQERIIADIEAFCVRVESQLLRLREIGGLKKIENPKIDEILEAVCNFYGVTEGELKSKSRKSEIREARQAAMRYLKETTTMSLQAIGVVFNRDRGTVNNAVNKNEPSELANYKLFKQAM